MPSRPTLWLGPRSKRHRSMCSRSSWSWRAEHVAKKLVTLIGDRDIKWDKAAAEYWKELKERAWATVDSVLEYVQLVVELLPIPGSELIAAGIAILRGQYAEAAMSIAFPGSRAPAQGRRRPRARNSRLAQSRPPSGKASSPPPATAPNGSSVRADASS